MNSASAVKKKNWLRNVLIALGIVLTLVVVFGAGYLMGRAGNSPRGPFPNFPRADRRAGHGAIGAIQNIEGQKLTIKMRDGKSQVVIVNNETRLEKNFQKIALGDFQLNDQVVVIGSPNADGEIEARLVGIVDASFRPARPFPAPTESR